MATRSKRLNTGQTEIVEKQTGRQIVKKQIIKAKSFISKTGVTIETCYCRKCMKNKRPEEFYDCVDNGFIDANGKMSICKDCCNDVFDVMYESSGQIMDKAMLKTCRYLNIFYSETALGMTIDHVESVRKNGIEIAKPFGTYKAKLHIISNRADFNEKTASTEDLTFREATFNTSIDNGGTLEDNVPDAIELRMRWGSSLEYDDYVWLEKELAEWKKTHKCDTKAEQTLLEQICLTGLAIRKARDESRSPGSLIKEYQELMKTANVDPAKTSAANSGKSKETFSEFIKTIEENEPAEYFEDKKLFKDFDNLNFYFEKYILRPLKNFVTQSRDFDVSADSEEDDQDESSGEYILGE